MDKSIAGFWIAVILVSAPIATGCQSTSADEERLGRALTLHQDGRYEAAIVEYNEVLTIRENSPEIYYNLAQIADRRGNHNRAEELYEAAIRNYRPEDTEKRAQAHMALGAIHFTRQNYVVARNEYEKALELTPTDSRVLYNLGVVLEELIPDNPANEERAIAAYHAALDFAPDFGDAHLELAFLYETQGKIERARHHHSLAARYGVDSSLLVERLNWWRDWFEQEVTARRGTGASRIEGKIVVHYPPSWSLGNAARAGTTIMRTYLNTAAIIIGERAAIQIVGPEPLVRFDLLPPDMLPARFAKAQLIEWLERNAPDAHAAYTAWAGPADDEAAAEGEAADEGWGSGEGSAAEALREQGGYTILGEEPYSFADGTTGFRIRARYESSSEGTRVMNYYFYLGEAHSYVAITTQQETGENVARTRYTLERSVSRIQEATRTAR